MPGTSAGRSAIIFTRSIAAGDGSRAATSRTSSGTSGRATWRGSSAARSGFFYQHLARGCRRVVFDGLEPAERFSDSIQFEFFEYVYHHVLRKEDEWAAREWLREKYRAFEAAGAQPTATTTGTSAACICTRRPRSCSTS